MSKILRALAPLAAAFAGAAALSGCVSLLPASKPAQLYTFVPPAEAPAGAVAGEGRIGVIAAPPVFPRASGGDQLLTLTGSEAAYIAQARWVAPAPQLFADAVEQAFLGSPVDRLVRRSDFGAGSMTLRMDLDRFETAYAAAGSAPVVKIVLKATLLQRGGDFAAEQVFTASVPAQENRIGAIVSAYARATAQVVGDLRGWVERESPRIAAAQSGADAPAPGFGARPRPRPAAGAAAPAVEREVQR